jgi:hypothetical protein
VGRLEVFVLHHEDCTSLVGLGLELLHDGKKTIIFVPKIIILLFWLDSDSKIPFLEVEPMISFMCATLKRPRSTSVHSCSK